MALVTRMFIGLTDSGLDPSSNNTWRLSVKVGDLVRDKANGVYGIIIEKDCPEGMFHVLWNHRTREAFSPTAMEYYLEVINESR